MNSNKPYFEERWPMDCEKWKDKTPEDKFKTAAKVLFLIAFAAIVLQAVITGKDSVWYYCLNGQWDSGINLNSITSCIIDTDSAFWRMYPHGSGTHIEYFLADFVRLRRTHRACRLTGLSCGHQEKVL